MRNDETDDLLLNKDIDAVFIVSDVATEILSIAGAKGVMDALSNEEFSISALNLTVELMTS